MTPMVNFFQNPFLLKSLIKHAILPNHLKIQRETHLSMDSKLTSKDKKLIGHPDDVFAIMQRILQRENKIDKKKNTFVLLA